MNTTRNRYTRRCFLKTAGAAGLGSLLSAADDMSDAFAAPSEIIQPEDTVPRRPFGKTGENVSILALGGYFDALNNQSLLKQAILSGVTYWESSFSCKGGKEGYGVYLKHNPQDRKKIFLSAKTSSKDPVKMGQELDETLSVLNTSYIDYFVIHAVDNAEDLNADIRKWADQKKSEGKIKFFGFSTHQNMEDCIIRAAKFGWIDGIMTTYNYRLMNTDKMKMAVDACVKAGIGLSAIKSQAELTNPKATIGLESPTAMKLTAQFMKKGFTLQQAKLKAIWENPHIASICSLMPNMTILVSNVAAALDKTSLSTHDLNLLKRYSDETSSCYCSGCANVCETAISGKVPISKVMRYLMYYHSYGDRDRARYLYNALPIQMRKDIANLDYFESEKKCPQKIAIGKFMRQAAKELMSS
ncbi:MAG: aldo/keto reductase [Proteobacteria bacterium]|nr:aldo/keto reductase [Pseudomonadota bacterium]